MSFVSPTLSLVYLPHLDYNLQRVGPGDARAAADFQQVDDVAGDLIAFYEARGVRVIVLSEYGYWGEELIGPLETFDKAGYRVTFATPTGKRPVALPPSMDPEYVDQPSPAPYTGPEVKDAETIAKMRVASRVAAQALQAVGKADEAVSIANPARNIPVRGVAAD